MTEPVPASSVFYLLQLPEDVQLSMLLAFDIRELIICKRVCRSLAGLIARDISIQYKIELARSGRIDGNPPIAATVADRLSSLREHRARFYASDHPIKRLRGQPFGSLGALSFNGFITTVSEGTLHLRRPASISSNIEEQKFAHSMWDLRLVGFNTSSCVTDVAQDLLVFSRRAPNTLTVDCFIYSLSKGGPHPEASQSSMTLSIVPEGVQYDSWDSIQILGDLIAWNVPHAVGRRCWMRVINWKTGIAVWEFDHDLWSRCRLVSESLVVVVTLESLLVYGVDRRCLETSSTPRSTTDTALCILQLPAWSSIRSSRSLLVRSYIQFPPPIGPNDRPFYRHDPDLTLLTLHVHYVVDTPEDPDDEPGFVQYAMFIPVSTIKTSVELATPPPPPPPHPPPLGGSPHVRVVQWADWGRAGTRIVHLDSDGPCYFSPMGCSCAVTQRRHDASGTLFLRILVFDAHPWAWPDSPARHRQHAYAQEETEWTGSRFLCITESDTLGGAAFTESIRTTFPFDVTRRDISLGRDDRCPTVVLGEDGLVLVSSPA